MPIRINLLAEAQAQEELRRKDPVKRAGIVAGVVVSGFVAWSIVLQGKIMGQQAAFNGVVSQWKTLEKPYNDAVEQRRRNIETEEKLSALQNYTTNRFLWGTALNGVQQTLGGVDDVQVIRLKGEQTYVQTEETKPRTNGAVMIPGKPATASEKVVLHIEAIDSNTQPGSQVSRFKQNINSVPYFQERLQKTNGVLLTSLSAPQSGPLARSPYVMFTLQCSFPEKVR